MQVDLTTILNLEASNGRVLINGRAAGEPASILLPANCVQWLITSLASFEETQKEDQAGLPTAMFFYGGVEVQATSDQGQAHVILKCLPSGKVTFELSALQLEELGRVCLDAAKSKRLTSGRKPN